MPEVTHCGLSQFNRLGKGAVYLGLAISLTLTVASAQIASGTTGIDATGNAKSEMAACNSGKTQQSRATCITEVKNANAAKRAGKLDSNGDQFSANALKRCEVFKGDDQAACKARIDGDVKTQGSVAEGGVIREVETVVAPAQP